MSELKACPFCGAALEEFAGKSQVLWHGDAECPLALKWHNRKWWNHRTPEPSSEDMVEGWQPIETAEKTPTKTVLLARFVGSPYGWVLGSGHYNQTKGSFEGEPLDTLHKGFTFDRATHWRPLPEPPARAALDTIGSEK